MVEALVAFGIFRPLFHRQQRIELHSYEYGVFHLALGISRVNVPPLDFHRGCGRIEVLELQLAYRPTVHRIGVVGTEAGHVELDHSAAYLLVRGEAYLDFRVLHFRMFHQILDGIHYFGDSRLVVSSEQRGTVGGDYGLALIAGQFREVGYAQGKSGNPLELYVPAVVVPDNLRFDILARCVRRGIHVGDEAYGRSLMIQV